MKDATVAIRFILFAAAMLAFGTAAFRVYVPELGADVARRLVGAIRAAAIVTFLASLAMVAVTAADMTGSDAAAASPAMLATVLFGTEFGHAWCWHLGFTLGLIGAAFSRFAGPTLVLAGLTLASLGFVGHAADMEGLPGLGHELNQAVHLLAAGAWLGGLWPLYSLLRLARPADPAVEDGVAHFSQMGYVAVALIAATGIINACMLVGSVGALFGTAYGRLLSVKVALYVLMVAIALTNRLMIAPRLAHDTTTSARLARSVVIEQALGLAILLAVSILGTWPPAAMGHAM
ncbi:MAG TPA: copper homeostasis membrane protein CopD [Stellaceae bacterium]|jgi:putative copper resistance protein D